MKFRKVPQENNTFQPFILFGTVILLVGIFVSSTYVYFLLLLGILLLTIYGLSLFYEKHVDDYLSFDFVKPEVKVYQDDEGYIEMDIEQKGIFPLLNARLTIEMDDSISFVDGVNQKRRYVTFVSHTFNLMFWEKRRFRFRFKANRRGVSTIRMLKLHLPNVFGFGSIYLTSSHIKQQEIVVYPRRQKVENMNLLTPQSMGNHRAKHSLFDHPSLPVGTRDYQRGDSFNKIHWKATAKEGDLQTKVFEKSSQINWCFLLNVRSKSSLGAPEQIEEWLEQLAYMTQVATKQGIPFKVYVNITSIDRIPFVHQPEGEGEEHYAQTLEMLARLKILTFTKPYDHLLYYVWKHASPPAYIIQIGHTEESDEKYLNQFKQRGSSVVYLRNGKISASPEQSEVSHHA
ncbi:DUF58 domain-containing protein [Halalkalibacillus halophilus]|uniref:DUF58 domain-containing protein n=1 Tax=Halalkalibacillus halophilus TaxID=392827 RepID=UPI0004202D21|nr:DUF58 domain-containing protein [Halalkalibacillus halophilus]